VQFSKSPDPEIVSLINNYESNKVGRSRSPDYISYADSSSNGVRLTWPDQLIPIPVYITLTSPVQSAFVDNVYESFKVWEQATNRAVRFKEVYSPIQARIFLTLQDGPLIHSNDRIGQATFTTLDDPDQILENLKVSITVNTGEKNTYVPIPERKRQINRYIIHELGHALGIWGHSPDPNDIMYAHPIVSQLSQRDVNTVRKLYGLRVSQQP
jgi:predicted Zn-dependent protease